MDFDDDFAVILEFRGDDGQLVVYEVTGSSIVQRNPVWSMTADGKEFETPEENRILALIVADHQLDDQGRTVVKLEIIGVLEADNISEEVVRGDAYGIRDMIIERLKSLEEVTPL